LQAALRQIAPYLQPIKKVKAMTQLEFLDIVSHTWRDWQAALAQVNETQMTQPGIEGHWSVKDVIAHITWYEREMVGVMQTRALVGSDLWGLPTHERNAAIYEQNKDRPLPEVLAESQQIHQQMMSLLATLTDDELNDPGRFRDMPPDWIPWQLIAQNSNEHYADHTAVLQSWLNA
jgi:hypothetical protein